MADTEIWKAKGALKREEILSLIPRKWRLPKPLPPPSELPDVTGNEIRQYLSYREIEITETDAECIVKKATTGEWKCEEIAEAFCHRAALAHQMINCLHEIFFNAAIESAKQLDLYFDRDKKPLGPLHGLPISLKDTIHVQGVHAGIGYMGWLGYFTREKGRWEGEGVRNSAIGKDFWCHTLRQNKRSSMVFLNRNEQPYHRSHNKPKESYLVVGGSSGGKGGLLALRGSVLGLGTDIGSSVRTPAGWNGCFGLRPSTGRYPYQGIASTIDGQLTVPFVVGPMATSAKALTLMTTTILSLQPWKRDPLVHELPWKDAQFTEVARRFNGLGEKLAFGIMFTDGYCESTASHKSNSYST